ncbi:MAG: conserved hypothetical protein [Methanobrevibacter sp. CfCl-M3]
MNEEKINAIKFKRNLQENAWKNSGAKTLHEYVLHVNNVALKSYKKNLKSI